MVPACPRCGLVLDRRESGYVVGAHLLNMIAAELVFAAIFVVVLILLWPTPWDLLTYGGGGLMVLLPIVFYPYSKAIFLGFDLLFRPAGHDAGELPAPENSLDPARESAVSTSARHSD